MSKRGRDSHPGHVTTIKVGRSVSKYGLQAGFGCGHCSKAQAGDFQACRWLDHWECTEASTPCPKVPDCQGTSHGGREQREAAVALEKATALTYARINKRAIGGAAIMDGPALGWTNSTALYRGWFYLGVPIKAVKFSCGGLTVGARGEMWRLDLPVPVCVCGAGGSSRRRPRATAA